MKSGAAVITKLRHHEIVVDGSEILRAADLRPNWQFFFFLFCESCFFSLSSRSENLFLPLHRVGVVVMQVALAAGEAGHGPLVSRGRLVGAAGSRRWRDQGRVIVRSRAGMRHTWTTPARESLAKRPTFRVTAGPGLARVSAITHVHPAQRLGQDAHL